MGHVPHTHACSFINVARVWDPLRGSFLGPPPHLVFQLTPSGPYFRSTWSFRPVPRWKQVHIPHIVAMTSLFFISLFHFHRYAGDANPDLPCPQYSKVKSWKRSCLFFKATFPKPGGDRRRRQRGPRRVLLSGGQARPG